MNDAQSHTEPVARKDHRCDYCGGIIQAGTKYNRDGLVYDGTATTWKSHIVCQKLVDKLVEWDGMDEGIGSDGFHETMYHECWNILGRNPYQDKMTLSQMIEVVKDKHLSEVDNG